MTDGSHLSPDRRRLLKLGDDERIREIQDDKSWVDYPQAEGVFEMISNMLSTPDRNQAPCLLVYGDGGTGKSSIVRKLQTFGRFRDQLIFVDLTVKPDGARFPELLARSLGIPAGFSTAYQRGSNSIPREIEQIVKLRKLKGIVLDELQDAFLVPQIEQKKNLSLIKGLSNAPVGLSVFGFGTISARNALQSDSQFFRRFHPVELRDWADTDGFRSFLVGLEEDLLLRNPSFLDSEDITRFLLERTGGRMDSVIKLIRAAACYAIRGGEEKITVELLKEAYRNPWGY